MNAFPSGRDRTRHPAIAGSSLAGGSNTAARHAAREQDREPELHRKRRGIKFHANTDKVNVVKDPAIYRADREMNLAHFKELMQIFRKSSNNDTGTISIDDFKRAFAKVLGQGLTDEQMSILFMKIDANTDNAIDWDDFSTYMLLRAEGQKLMREQAETQLFDSESAHHPISTAHKDVVVRIQYIESLKRYMSCSREGTVCYWNDRLKLQRAYRNAGQPRNELTEGHKKAANAGPGTQHLRWIHDAVFMDNVNKIALASDDHQITIYDGTTLQKALCLDLQNVNVMTLDYWTDRENPNSTESMLLYGTDSGCVNVFTFNNDKMFKVGVRQKDQAEHIFLEKEGSTNKALKSWGSLWKRRAHGDWTVKVKYVPDLHAIISCSPDPRESLVVAIMDLNRRWQVHVLPVHKGVNAFAFCRFPVALITGGTDRQLRLWNPHRLHHPMAAMKGHDSPIVDITVNELNGQVISLSVDKDIKIWDIRKQQCLQTITDSVVHRPEDIISAIMFNPHARNVVTGTYALNAYYLKEQTAITDNPKSHDFPIRAVMYNSSFKQIVSGCDGSVVNVWDAFSGQKTFRFSEAHGKSEITAMAFDASGRRLVTGGRDGTIKIWNFNNGQLMQELVKKDKTEVTGLAYIDMRESTYFVATGWNRKITMFTDDPDSLTLYPTFTWPDPSLKGSALGWHEDDILSMVFCPPNILATSSYDGEIVICNLHSGHVLHRLRPLGRDEKINPLKSRSIDKVVFLQERSGMREAASLVSTGSDGMIRFWNIFHGTLMFEVDGTESRSEGIFTMVTNSSNTLLFTGDALGWVCVFDIHETALNDDSPAAMPLVVSFRAHVRSVTSMDIIEGPDVLVTCSADCTIRMFSFKGEYIGIFGQSALWELGQPASYMHPTKPLDVMQAEAAAAEAAEARAALLNGQTEAFVKPRLAASAGVEEYADDESGQARAEDAVNIASPKLPAIQRVNLLPSLTASNSVNRSSNPTNLAQDLAAASKPRRVRTPELLAKEYGSWYAKSQYARDTFTNRTKRKSNLLRPLNIGPGAGLRVYHRLQPYDLADVGSTSSSGGGPSAGSSVVAAAAAIAAGAGVKLPLIGAVGSPATAPRRVDGGAAGAGGGGGGGGGAMGGAGGNASQGGAAATLSGAAAVAAAVGGGAASDTGGTIVI